MILVPCVVFDVVGRDLPYYQLLLFSFIIILFLLYIFFTNIRIERKERQFFNKTVESRCCDPLFINSKIYFET
jgi:hypothetical protein